MTRRLFTLLLLGISACAGERTLTVRGTVEIDQVNVAPQMAARVLAMRVNEGDHVAPGDTIAILGVADAGAQMAAREARVAAAEAALRDLQAGARVPEIRKAQADLQAADAEAARTATELERARSLVRDTVISQRDYDAAAAAARVATERRDAARQTLRLLQQGSRPAQISAAQAELRQARADLAGTGSRLGDLVLVSPVAGTVLVRAAEPGDVLSAGIPAAVVGDTGRLYVRAYATQRALQSVKAGTPAMVTPDGWTRGVPATVASIQPAAEFTPRVALTEDERADLLFGVRLKLQSPLPAGLWTVVHFGTAAGSAR
ncbi:MAG TPA: HlyD family efflux transporter periplasmic adaptor subunit [Gemmatimonadales bacterium]|jgi:HlyD family secretion protein|nr:HlyD family efflux transporter periplasmic adaptor subunit [Gemmatimonadales bacterium]